MKLKSNLTPRVGESCLARDFERPGNVLRGA